MHQLLPFSVLVLGIQRCSSLLWRQGPSLLLILGLRKCSSACVLLLVRVTSLWLGIWLHSVLCKQGLLFFFSCSWVFIVLGGKTWYFDPNNSRTWHVAAYGVGSKFIGSVLFAASVRFPGRCCRDHVLLSMPANHVLVRDHVLPLIPLDRWTCRHVLCSRGPPTWVLLMCTAQDVLPTRTMCHVHCSFRTGFAAQFEFEYEFELCSRMLVLATSFV